MSGGNNVPAAAVSVDIVVISLADAARRRATVDDMFRGSPLKWSYFDAHRGLDHPDLRYDESLANKHYGRPLTKPQIAVYSSHYAVLKQFVDTSTADFILVLEDDVIFDMDFPLGTLGQYCSERGIDYIRLYGKFYAHAVLLGHFFDRSLIRFRSSPLGAQAYLMSRKGAESFTRQSAIVRETIDLAMDRFWDTGMPLYAVQPYPAIERFSPTSIPIPPLESRPSQTERGIFAVNRIVRKLNKVAANIRLRAADRRMDGSSFRQVFDSDLNRTNDNG